MQDEEEYELTSAEKFILWLIFHDGMSYGEWEKKLESQED